MMRNLSHGNVSFVALVLGLILSGCGGGGSQPTGGSGNPVPSLSSVAPPSITAGSAAVNLTLSGTKFLGASQVLWNGSAVTTGYVSDTLLTAQIPSSDLTTTGTASITVSNPTPGGGTSSAIPFMINPEPNPVPVLSALSPNGTTAGSGSLTLTATGTGFISASQIVWNGNALTTAYISGTSLT